MELDLEEELEDGFNEILVEVEVIMSHLCRQYHEGLPLAFLMQLLSMLIRN
jgi:hypothetical protein